MVILPVTDQVSMLCPYFGKKKTVYKHCQFVFRQPSVTIRWLPNWWNHHWTSLTLVAHRWSFGPDNRTHTRTRRYNEKLLIHEPSLPAVHGDITSSLLITHYQSPCHLPLPRSVPFIFLHLALVWTRFFVIVAFWSLLRHIIPDCWHLTSTLEDLSETSIGFASTNKAPVFFTLSGIEYTESIFSSRQCNKVCPLDPWFWIMVPLTTMLVIPLFFSNLSQSKTSHHITLVNRADYVVDPSIYRSVVGAL